MRRGGGWGLRIAALCCTACTLYGAASLLLVQKRLSAGATEVRLLREGAEAEELPAADEPPPFVLAGDAEGSLRFGRYEAAVFHGVTGETLAKGAGHIPASAELNAPGNCVLYGHRDSAFRFLEQLKEGDELTLWSRAGEGRYRVSEIEILEPDDPEIFRQSDTTLLSLVTCYPFTFVGPALQRCVVRAERIPAETV